MDKCSIAAVLYIFVAHVFCQDHISGQLCSIGDETVNSGLGNTTCPGTGDGVDVYYSYNEETLQSQLTLEARSASWFACGIGGPTGGDDTLPSVMDGTLVAISNLGGANKEALTYILSATDLDNKITGGTGQWSTASVTVNAPLTTHVLERAADATNWDLPTTTGSFSMIVAASNYTGSPATDYFDIETSLNQHTIFETVNIILESYTFDPSMEPTSEPTLEPTLEPTVEPTLEPTLEPTTRSPATPSPFAIPPSSPTVDTDAPTTDSPTTDSPTTDSPTTDSPTTDSPTTDSPTTDSPTTDTPTTDTPTTADPTTADPTTADPTTAEPTTADPTTDSPTTDSPTTSSPTQDTPDPTTASPTTESPTTADPTTDSPTTDSPTTDTPTTASPTTDTPTTDTPTTYSPTQDTPRPTTDSPTTATPTTAVPTQQPTTSEPTEVPTDAPTTAEPTFDPDLTLAPTMEPTLSPTMEPSVDPTNAPTVEEGKTYGWTVCVELENYTKDQVKNNKDALLILAYEALDIEDSDDNKIKIKNIENTDDGVGFCYKITTTDVDEVNVIDDALYVEDSAGLTSFDIIFAEGISQLEDDDVTYDADATTVDYAGSVNQDEFLDEEGATFGELIASPFILLGIVMTIVGIVWLLFLRSNIPNNYPSYVSLPAAGSNAVEMVPQTSG